MNEKERDERGRISSCYVYGKSSIPAAVGSISRTNQCLGYMGPIFRLFSYRSLLLAKSGPG